jgi:hypothetical protein
VLDGWVAEGYKKERYERVSLVTFEDYLMHNSYKEMTLQHKRDCIRLLSPSLSSSPTASTMKALKAFSL